MKPLLAESFRNDPRIAQARELLAQALADHQQPITDIRPPDPERKTSYDQLLQTFSDTRAGNLFYPYLASGLGHGPLVELADGSIKFDLISGIGVHHWGHSSPLLANAALDAALADTLMQGNLQQNPDSAEISSALLALAAPSDLRHCFLSTSGAMANENALKFVFHKRPGTDRILAFEHGFAGRTLALAQLTDKPAYRVGLPTVLAVDYLPFFDPACPDASTTRALVTLRQHLQRYPNRHAATWFELILGEGGFYPGSHAFFQALMTELRAARIAIVADEVQTFGRTLSPFAFQHFDLAPLIDIVTVGKLLQVCATLFTPAYRPAPGLLSQTFTASTAAICAARAILRELSTGNFFTPAGRNAQVHARFTAHFSAIANRHPGKLRGPHGLGGMLAFQIGDGSEPAAKTFLRQLFDAGVIAFYCGDAPTRIRFLPPIGALTDAHIDRVCQILESTLAQTP